MLNVDPSSPPSPCSTGKRRGKLSQTLERTEKERHLAHAFALADYAEALCVLAVADAALGNKDDAIREARRAVELMPISKSEIEGHLLIKYLAVVYAWIGEKNLVCEQLAIAAKLPGFLRYGELRRHPNWDDPRFEKIVASLGTQIASQPV